LIYQLIHAADSTDTVIGSTFIPSMNFYFDMSEFVDSAFLAFKNTFIVADQIHGLFRSLMFARKTKSCVAKLTTQTCVSSVIFHSAQSALSRNEYASAAEQPLCVGKAAPASPNQNA
jgi:hypothetical protein